MGKEQTPEELGREAGEAIANAIADNLETVIMRLADSIATLRAEQAELRDEVCRLSSEQSNLYGAYMAHIRTTSRD
jgi:FtsZ-binding cell division protein ZapB